MPQTGTYYLGRVIKMGQLNQESLLSALQNPRMIFRGNNGWTVISQYQSEFSGTKYFFGKLCKFLPQDEIQRLNRSRNAPEASPQTDVIKAQSPFIYVPKYSGICYLRVSNDIEIHTFNDKLTRIVKEAYDNLFVDCQIEMITDLRAFQIKLAELEKVIEITVKINPPNPLFGIAWQSLKEYLEKRNAGEMKLQEKGSEEKPLKTKLPETIDSILASDGEAPLIREPIDITDGAILMAADGYGDGKLKGIVREKTVTIRTSETVRNFDFDKDPLPDDLARKAIEMLESVNSERDMSH